MLNKILGMTHVCTKFIPKLLTTEEKVMMKMSLRRLLLVMNGYDPETKQRSSQ